LDLLKDGCHTIRLKEIGVLKIRFYEAPLSAYLEQDSFIEAGFDRQKCCPLSAMKEISV